MDISVHLPQDMIEEILPRLPVKSLLRFRCVSKSWGYLIGSERFIKSHLQKSTLNASLAHHRVIFFSYSCGIKQCTLQSLLNNGPSIDLTPIDDPLNQFSGCALVGCCNGLLCMLKVSEHIIILWNPATRVYTKLPKVGYIDSKLGFGWDEQSGAHKVFVVVSENIFRHRIIGKVYSTKTNSWKTVATDVTLRSWCIGKFARGKLYWFDTFGSNHIESFDLATEEFGIIKLPFNPTGQFYAKLGDIGGCLCIVFRNPFDVWVMKESWLKLATIPIPRDHVTELDWFSPSFGEGPKGEIFLIFGYTLLVYNPKDNVLWGPRKIEGSIECLESKVYVESLVSLALVESS